MADDEFQSPLEGLPLLKKALVATGRLAACEEVKEEAENETNDKIEAPEESEAAKSADFIPYIPAPPSSPPKKSHKRGHPRKYRRDNKSKPIMTNEDGTPIPKSRYGWIDGHKPKQKKADEIDDLQESGPEITQRAKDNLKGKESDGNAVD
ncbi:hypothetical protein B5807_06596 [Epicoccum nigrum]|uniref:Uncharacterized protein n=1 Tax=Epicoccum nigrum TaxID=105696 RepID=A0A1Y2LVS5_EPING|nr:hypothetical protein B5807_06596 [Epicoccum nigrum]